jgi:hypothetical protein
VLTDQSSEYLPNTGLDVQASTKGYFGEKLAKVEELTLESIQTNIGI